MDQEEYYQRVRIKQGKLFPQFKEGDIIEDNRTSYGFFAPSYYFDPNAPFITPEIVRELTEGKRMLSVGCGPAYLERFLVRAEKISSTRIELADIDPHYRRRGFKMHVFDMLKPWPGFEGKFDYTIFPNSYF